MGDAEVETGFFAAETQNEPSSMDRPSASPRKEKKGGTGGASGKGKAGSEAGDSDDSDPGDHAGGHDSADELERYYERLRRDANPEDYEPHVRGKSAGLLKRRARENNPRNSGGGGGGGGDNQKGKSTVKLSK